MSKIPGSKSAKKMSPDAAKACPCEENGTPEKTQNPMGTHWGY
jgi:hypothetical protein